MWAVIVDAERYAEWHPLVVRVDGTYADAARLTLHLEPAEAETMVIRARVAKWLPARELNQVGGTFGILRFDHEYLLRPIPGGTHLIQREAYRGIGTLFWDSSWVGPAYSGVNDAIARRVGELSSR